MEILHLKEINDVLRIVSTNEIDYDWIRHLFLPSVGSDQTSTVSDKLINAELQLAFWSTFPNILARLYSENPLPDLEDHRKSILWSSLEVLARTHAIGAQLVMEAVRPAWDSHPLIVRVLVAFRAIHDKDFSTTRKILEPALEEVKKTYATSSMEFVIVGTQLANCYNALAMEIKTELLVEDMVNAIWPVRKSDHFTSEDVALLRSVPDLYLFVAYSDSLIGQGKYGRAKPLLNGLAHCRITTNDTALLCLLRLLKISRRQSLKSISENWSSLENAICLLGGASSGTLYQCFEEAMCMLSVIDSLDKTQISRAKGVIDALDVIEITRFHGSDIMKLTLQEYHQELKVHRRDFGLFSVIGPQEHYCRNIQERFPKASIAFIERIGAANWERYKRLKEMPQLEEVVEPVVTAAPSKFHDSGIGSSLQSSAIPATIQTPRSRAASKLSINTVLGPGLSGLLEVPTEIMAGKPYYCEWCRKSLKMVDPKRTWP